MQPWYHPSLKLALILPIALALLVHAHERRLYIERGQRAVAVRAAKGVAPGFALAIVADGLQIERRQIDALGFACFDHQHIPRAVSIIGYRVEGNRMAVFLWGRVVRQRHAYHVLHSARL